MFFARLFGGDLDFNDDITGEWRATRGASVGVISNCGRRGGFIDGATASKGSAGRDGYRVGATRNKSVISVDCAGSLVAFVGLASSSKLGGDFLGDFGGLKSKEPLFDVLFVFVFSE